MVAVVGVEDVADTSNVQQRKRAPRGEAPTELPGKPAAVLRAIEAGNYGTRAREAVRDVAWRQGEPAARYVGHLRIALYEAGADKAGDALALQAVD